MATFAVSVKIKAVEGKKSVNLNLIVDTGAFISIVPRATLRKIGVQPYWRREFVLANGARIKRSVGVAIFKWNGNEGASEVIFGESDDKPLLGALTLESMALKVNPRRKKLEPEELLLLKTE